MNEIGKELNYAAKGASKQTAEGVESLLTALIARRLAGETWDAKTVAARLRRLRFEGQPQELWLLDDRPLLQIWPPEVTRTVREGAAHLDITVAYMTFPHGDPQT